MEGKKVKKPNLDHIGVEFDRDWKQIREFNIYYIHNRVDPTQPDPLLTRSDYPI